MSSYSVSPSLSIAIGVSIGFSSSIKGSLSTAIDEMGDTFQDDMDPDPFNKLRTRTSMKFSTRDTLTHVWQPFSQVQSKMKFIRAEREVIGKTEEHLILVPPDESILLFIGGWFDVSILEWFAMSLRKWGTKKGHPECKYLARV
nr:hypothetical protein [Tanacetum cinerariifolium]